MVAVKRSQDSKSMKLQILYSTFRQVNLAAAQSPLVRGSNGQKLEGA